MFLDSDATVTSGALRTLVGMLDAEDRIGLVGPSLIYPAVVGHQVVADQTTVTEPSRQRRRPQGGSGRGG